ncbi:MAG: type I-F CRISPR-associated protein Csy1, partial [Thalassolituus sp. CG17_big_fil_post_rev_8_21_14_2_50_53_8]
MEISTDRTQTFRQAITAFIEERRDAKLKGNNTGIETAAKYEYTTWLADAARRVNQIQAVTHVLKATHPDARGSSLHLTPNNLPQHREIGSHLLGDTFAEDIVGNAAALDVFKFLKTEVEGKRLFDWMQEADADLQAALSANVETAQEWMQAFSSLIRVESQPVSHVAAKQLYWLVGEEPIDNAEYQLLQPLFSSAL